MSEHAIASLGGAAVIAVVVALLARSRGRGVALPLVLAGIVVGLLPIGPEAPADPEFVLVAILAPLLFGESLSSSYLDLRKVRRPVLALAVGLVIVSTFAVGGLVAAVVPGIPLAAALALGAILGPTDAVAVSAAARHAALPRRLVNILEGESLVNDGTALTLLRVAIVATAAGSVTGVQALGVLALSVLGGVGVGAVGGATLVVVLRRSRDTVAASALLVVAPFALYTIAEAVEGSGILSVVVAGLMVAHATYSDPRYRGRLQVASVWRQLTFILSSVAFLLIGIEIPDVVRQLGQRELPELALLVPIVVVILIVVRGLFVAAMVGLRTSTRRSGRDSGWRGWAVVAWAGARGPVSGLAAFSLPLALDDGSPFPERELLIGVTLCTVVVTLLLAPTLGPLARVLRLPPDDDAARLRRVRLSLAQASLDRLDELVAEADRNEEPLPDALVERLRESASARVRRAETVIAAGSGTVTSSTARRLGLEMVRAEQEELLRLRDEDGLSDALMRELMTELDARRRAVPGP